MRHLDRFGLPVSATAASCIEWFDAALEKLLSFHGDPVADLDRAMAAQPGFLMPFVAKAVILGLSTERSLATDAGSVLAAGRRQASGASPRELGHALAVEAWLEGRFSAACELWEDILVDHPRDALALFAAHQADFLLGQSSELRDRVARRLADLVPGSALEGFALGMYAFGLGEMGDYARALEAGSRAVERNGRDAWAIHAVAHVYEMTNATDAGEAWLAAQANGWVQSNLSVHLWWHRALYELDQLRWDRVLELYDAQIRRPASPLVMELLDASSLLWRLGLCGIEVGARWRVLAAEWEPRLDEAWYAFNDMHAMMAFAAARRGDLEGRLLATLQHTAAAPTENGVVTRHVGLPVAEALSAYSERRFATAATLLGRVRTGANRAGGSHAQRDVLAQTWLAAAARAGERALARALSNERLALRPRSPLNQYWADAVEQRT